MKDSTKSFPSNDQSLGVLRWRCVGKNDETKYLPMLITIWCSVNDSSIDVTVEYELTSEFIENNITNTEINDVKIILPLQGADISLKDDVDTDLVDFVTEDIGTVFNISKVSIDDPQGSFEFTINDVNDEELLFPMELQFNIDFESITDSDNCFGKVQVLDVVSSTNDEEESLPFDLRENIVSESYQIV